jgi:flagellar assembly protein FliH
MMNLPSEGLSGTQRYYSRSGEAETTLPGLENCIAPFEFRSFTGSEAEARQRSGGRDAEDADGTAWREETGQGPTHEQAVGAAREEGELEGRRLARLELEAEMQSAVGRERERLVEAVRQFAAMRERYFAEVEQQIVRLALAIAGRVLHRETVIDPLLLMGVVRVALEKMADRSGVALRVPSADVAGWERVLLASDLVQRPRVVEDARLSSGECVLETTMGVVELGVTAQLEEIEKGFFDLLNHRPTG